MRLLLLTAVLLAACATTARGAEAPPLRGRLVSIEAGASVAAALPAARSTALDEPQELSRLEQPSPAPPVAAPQQSGGVAALVGADQWHEAGFSGRGVRVAVIDTGFSGYEEAFADAVPPVRARSFRADGGLDGGSGHGFRAAQIVRELAPRAELLLLAFSTVDELAEAVGYAIEEEVGVISFSVGFIHNGPGDGSGAVNEIVDRRGGGRRRLDGRRRQLGRAALGRPLQRRRRRRRPRVQRGRVAERPPLLRRRPDQRLPALGPRVGRLLQRLRPRAVRPGRRTSCRPRAACRTATTIPSRACACSRRAAAATPHASSRPPMRLRTEASHTCSACCCSVHRTGASVSTRSSAAARSRSRQITGQW